MLDYKKNRVDYGEQLSPPMGYELDYAVATTYTLDLHALLCIPVALFYAKNLDGKASETRMDILDSIQKTGDKVRVYCQKGKIKVPTTHNRIVSFIDESVSEVIPTEPNSSFHPKVWIMRFVSKEGPTMYRFFNLSRNLTFDRSWDLAFYMEGFVSDRIQEKNKPLVHFLSYLKDQEDFQNSDVFLNDLATVQFEHLFDDVEFIPMGIPGYNQRLEFDFGKMIIVSPFVQVGALKYIKGQSRGKRFLFSRREELSKLKAKDFRGFKPFYLSESIVEGEDYREEGADDDIKDQNLHAKLFVGQKNMYVTWYLGSANCSLAAMDVNQEFMVKLQTSDRKYGIGNIRKLLMGEENQFFQEFEPSTQEDVDVDPDYGLEFRRASFHFSEFIESGGLKGRCELIEGDNPKYNLVYQKTADLPEELNDFEFHFSCLGRDDYVKLTDAQEQFVFDGINLENLSPFVKWRMTHKSGEETNFLIKMNINLPDERKDAIFRSIIENKEKFFQFLQFLLGREGGSGDLLSGLKQIGQGKSDGSIWSQDTPILEELLITAAREPERLKDINKIIEKLDSSEKESPIPKEFKEFWEVFKPFALND